MRIIYIYNQLIHGSFIHTGEQASLLRSFVKSHTSDHRLIYTKDYLYSCYTSEDYIIENNEQFYSEKSEINGWFRLLF